MKLLFCLFNYSPYGGLERDFLRVVNTALSRGHQIKILTQSWEGEIPTHLMPLLYLRKPPFYCLTNHGCAEYFSNKLFDFLQQEKFDAVIGFNKLPYLDYYYAADSCYRSETQKKHGKWVRFLARDKIYSKLESAVFSLSSKTRIFLLNPEHQKDYINYYHTPQDRFIHLIPGIGEDRKKPAHQIDLRNQLRREQRINEQESLILMVCSNYVLKGVDRAINAFAALPRALQLSSTLWVVGNGKARDQKNLINLIQKTPIPLERVKFWGPREDIVRFYAAADLLLHPALLETAGMVLIEALVAGLPIIVTKNCGYAAYIDKAKAGIILSEPFDQTELNQALTQLISHPDIRMAYREQALQYANTADLFHLSEQIMEKIENDNASKKP